MTTVDSTLVQPKMLQGNNLSVPASDCIHTVLEKAPFDNVAETIGQNYVANLVAMVGLLVTILISAIDHYISRNAKKKELRENWYFSVIVEPNLANIEEFYSKTVTCLNNGISKLNRKGRVTGLDKAKVNKEYKKIKNHFSLTFTTLVQSYDNKLATEVGNQINEIQDYATTAIDNFRENINKDKIHKDIMDYKVRLISLLYKGISKDKN